MLDEIIKKIKENMEKSLHFLTEDYKTVRSGKDSPSMVENIILDYYNKK